MRERESLYGILCKLLRIGLGISNDFPYALDEKEWQSLFLMAKKQTVLGVAYDALSLLPAKSFPRLLAMRYMIPTESIRGLNRLMNREAVRYTSLFAERNVRSVILKGQANARLYPKAFSRQSGDIDIWIPGGFDKVKQLLLDMGLVSKNINACEATRHISFRNENGIMIEIHHRPVEILFRNKELQDFFLDEFEKSTLTPEGFYSPGIRFALVMQLQHLYHHCIKEGVGLRHYMDYFILLTNSTEEDRKLAWSKIQRFGLAKACGGVMWLLDNVFDLSRELMLCSPDEKIGMRLYKNMMEEGNFGRGSLKNKGSQSSLKRWFRDRIHTLSWLRYDPLYSISNEIMYWKESMALIPIRIKRRKIFF